THPSPGARASSAGYRPPEFPVRSLLRLFQESRGLDRHSCRRKPHRADDPVPPAATGAFARQLPSVAPVLLPATACGALARRLPVVVPVPLASASAPLDRQLPAAAPVPLAFAPDRHLHRPSVQTSVRITPGFQ